jgi:beta-phosphoglucomutase-like phosphatase (HAD superfamily)
MRAAIFDYDGVIIRSEQGKALSWLLAALYIKGEVSEEFLRRLRVGDSAAVGESCGLARQRWPQEMDAVVALSGLSREETCHAVWEKLLDGYEGPLNPRDLEQIRASIKDSLILAHSEPIPGTVTFIQEALNKLLLALVTQATQSDVEEQAKAFRLPLSAFQVIECCGDPFYKDLPKTTDKKAFAYAIACAKLGLRPSEALAIEDSTSGLAAATAAGLTCIGLREPHNQQELSLAKLIVSDLSRFARSEVIEMITGARYERVIDVMQSYTAT